MKFHQRRKEKARLAELEAAEKEAEELELAANEESEQEAESEISAVEENSTEEKQTEQTSLPSDDELQQAENDRNATEQAENLDEDVPTVG